MSNVEFSYLYRDGGNYKKFGRVVFANPDQLDCSAIEKALMGLCLEDGLFIADQARVPDVFLFANGKLSLDDHCYHEFDTVRPTAENPTDEHMRSITDFVWEITAVGQRGWRVFDPYDSEDSFGHLLASRRM